MNVPDDDRDDPTMDWALGETLGEERAPDLLAAVREQLAARAQATRQPERSAWSQTWVVAAALLGIAVVVALAIETQSPQLRVAGPQDPQSMPLVSVTTIGDAEALPATTRGVEVVGGNDLTIAALRHLRDLEVLVVREPWNESFGLGLKVSAPRDVHYTTAECWATIAGFTKLRRLELRGTVHAGFLPAPGIGKTPIDWSGDVRAVAEAFAGLERLPRLERLTLRCMDTADIVLMQLPRLTALRHLDVSFNHGFEEAGIDAILQCKELRSLSLQGCQQLHARLLARLHELPELEVLDVGSIDGINWRAGTAELDMFGARQLRERADRLADRIGMGPVDQALEGLARCPKLRVLDISNGHWSSAGLASLGACRTLRELHAFGGQEPTAGWVAAMPKELERLELCGNYTDDLCLAVAAHLPNLRHLSLAACYGITDRGLRAIVGMRSLRVLDIKQMRGLTGASIDAVATATWLEEVDLRHCDFVEAAHVVQLRRALPKLRSLQTNVAEADVEAFLAKKQQPLVVTNRSELDAMPPATTELVTEGLGDDAMEKLAKLPLHTLELAAAKTATSFLGAGTPVAIQFSPLTDRGFAALATMAQLERLTLRRLDGLTPASDATLPKLSKLRELTFVGMPIRGGLMRTLATMPLHSLTFQEGAFAGDAETAFTAMQQLHSLRIVRCATFGKQALESLRHFPNLRLLDLSFCSQFGIDSSAIRPTEAIDLLLALPAVEDLTIQGWAPLDDTDLARLRAKSTLKRLVTDRGAETLR